MSKQTPARFASIIAGILLVASCASSPQANLYILDGQSAGVVADWGEQDLAIVVGPTGIPSYLKRDEIVTRDQRHKIETFEYEQWADQLGRNVSNVLVENISNNLNTQRVFAYESNFVTQADIALRIDITRFELEQGRTVVLNATWEIENRRTGATSLRSASFSTDTRSREAADIVAAMSDNLDKMALEMSQHLIATRAAS